MLGALAAPSALADDHKILMKCLKRWDKHPFPAKLTYKVMEAKVKVFGIGSDLRDDTKTKEPRLVLIKPSVNVMGKFKYHLLNPNGWYCLEADVNVMGKAEINLACTAKLASSKSGATVMGGSDKSGGVVVMGKTEIRRKGCK
jgi:hypothetical protein